MSSPPDIAGFIWSLADKLRGTYNQSEYGRVILPLVVLRRLDCVLEPTRAAVLAEEAKTRDALPALRERLLLKASKQPFYNTSNLVFRQLTSTETKEPRWRGFASLTVAEHQGDNLRNALDSNLERLAIPVGIK